MSEKSEVKFSEQTTTVIDYLKEKSKDFYLNFDVNRYNDFTQKFLEFYKNKLNSFRNDLLKEVGIVDFNINSKHILALLDFYKLKPIRKVLYNSGNVEEKESVAQETWVPYTQQSPGSYPFLEELLSIKDIEILRRRIQGSKSSKPIHLSYLTYMIFSMVLENFLPL